MEVKKTQTGQQDAETSQRETRRWGLRPAGPGKETKEGGIVTITFKDWIIKDKGLQVSQYDNLSCRLEVLGSLPEGWDWAMLVKNGSSRVTSYFW